MKPKKLIAISAIVLTPFIVSYFILLKFDMLNMFYPLVSLALSDSINPCTFVIYTMFLVALSVKEMGDSRKIYLVGLTFILAIYISYFLLGVGLTFFSKVIPVWVAGVLAICFGGYTIITGLLEKSRVDKSSARKAIFSSECTVVGALTLGFVISFTLLPCSAGSYMVYAILISRLNITLALILLLAYNFIFVLPLLLILFIMGGLNEVTSVSRFFVRHGRVVSVIAGTILVALGIYILLAGKF